jgi:hypothetical protein
MTEYMYGDNNKIPLIYKMANVKDRENLVALLSAQLSRFPLKLPLICIRFKFLFKMMHHSSFLTRFQPSYLRSWHRVKDSKLLASSFNAETMT